MSFNLTTFDAALQAKLNTASVNLSAQDYLLLTKAVAAAIEVSEGVSLLDLKGTANGIAGLDGSANVPLSQLLNAIPAQGGNSGKFLTTSGTATSWASPYPSQTGNYGRFLTTDGTNVSWAVPDPIPAQGGNQNKLLTTNGTSTSWTANPSLTALTTSADITVGDQAYIGPSAPAFETSATLTDPAVVITKTGTADSYAQVAFKNSTATSSTDFIAYMNNGDDTQGWIDMGITGASFNQATYGITGPGDGYIFHETKSGGSYKGNLVFATGANGTQNRIVFAAGGYESGNTQMTIIPDTRVHIEIPTPSTSATTGALTVAGGVGILGDMNIQGNVAIQGTITFGGAGTTVSTQNLSVSDPLVFVGKDNSADILDLGLVGEYKVGANKKYAGIVRDASDGVIKTFKDASTKPTSTVNFAEAGLAYADLQVGGLTASSITVGNVSNTEFGYLDGVTSAIQTQINAKANLAGGATFTGTIVLPSTTSIGNVDSTEIGYLDGVTSAIQTQINTKLDSSTASSTYLTQSNAASTYLTQSNASSTYLTQSNASSTYLTQSNASSTYAPLVVTSATPTFTSNNYTLVIGDAHKILLASNGSTAATVTIPLNSSVAFSTGTTITISQTGSGQLTLTPTGGVTINSYLSQTKFAGQYASVQLIKTGTDTWLAVGNLTA